MDNLIGDIKVSLNPEQVEHIIVTIEGDYVQLSVSDLHSNAIDSVLNKDLILGGLAKFLAELNVSKLTELKTIYDNK